MKQRPLFSKSLYGDRGSYHQTGKTEGQGPTHFLFLRRCLVWPRKGVGHGVGVGPTLGLRRKWSPSLSVNVQLGVRLQPRTVVKSEG